MIQKILKNRLRTGIAIIVAIPVLSPLLFLTGNDYVTQAVTRVLIYGVLVLSVEMCWGQAGIFTFGQAALFGLGAYVTGYLATRENITDIGLLLLLAVAAGSLVGLAIALFLFSGRRVGELYVALVTLAISYICERFANSWSVIGSANGIPGIPFPTFFGYSISSSPTMFFVALLVFSIALMICVFVVQSQFGMAMNAVRDDEERAEFFGYNRSTIQIVVFVFCAALAAAGGALFAMSEGFVSPSLSGLALSTTTVLWVVLGGKGTFFGPLLALAVLQALNVEMQNALPSFWPIIVGLLLLITMMFLPKGLMSLPSVFRSRRSSRRRPNSSKVESK